ncbi:MAG: (2Fe-2S)-binding protein [Acetobacter malorum]|uniref:(2Fe-2S)-binding protein n=1 Tax=Acetobacter malorum TaxID=178901 RepID=UPI0039E9F5A6
MAGQSTTITVNGVPHAVAAAADTPLLYVLRNDLALNGPKYGCGLGECGACTVLLAGRAARACSISLQEAAPWPVTTLEGLEQNGVLDPVQKAFVEEQAAQCGYCLNGMVMTVRALLNVNASPSRAQILEALQYNLCRCGTHVEIIRAACRACGLTEQEECQT